MFHELLLCHKGCWRAKIIHRCCTSHATQVLRSCCEKRRPNPVQQCLSFRFADSSAIAADPASRARVAERACAATVVTMLKARFVQRMIFVGGSTKRNSIRDAKRPGGPIENTQSLGAPVGCFAAERDAESRPSLASDRKSSSSRNQIPRSDHRLDCGEGQCESAGLCSLG
jgi:hypothetical protein